MNGRPKENDLLVTVVIPTFNRREQLEKAIRSVLDQNVPGVLVHVFDNCSDDSTQCFMADLSSNDPRVRYTRRDSNIGGLANYAESLRAVQTPFFTPLASDDWLLGGSLVKLLTELKADPTLGAVVSQTIHVTETGKELLVNPDPSWEYKRYEPSEFIPIWVEKGHFEWSSLMFRTDAKNSVGGLDIGTRGPSDVDFQAQLFLRYPIKLIEHKSAAYLNHPNQLSAQKDPKFAEGVFRMIRKAQMTARSETVATPQISAAMNRFALNWSKIAAQVLASRGGFSDYRRLTTTLNVELPELRLRTYFRACYFWNFLRSIRCNRRSSDFR